MKNYDVLAWTPEMVQRFWDYEANFPEKFFTRSRRYQIIRTIGQYLPRDCTVLDYGCGPGNLIAPLLDAGFSVAGMDMSPSARQSVQADYGGRERFLGVYDQDEIGRSGIRFDAIIVAEVIEHLYDEQLDSLLATLLGLATPDTYIIFTTPNEEDLQENHILCPVSGELFHRWQHVRSWSGATLKSYLEARAFKITRMFATDFDITLEIRGKNNPLRGRWWTALRRTLRYRRQPQRKRPHLVAVAKPAAAVMSSAQ